MDIGCLITASHETFGDVGVELPGPEPFAPISGFPWADQEYLQPLNLAVAAYPVTEVLFPRSRPRHFRSAWRGAAPSTAAPAWRTQAAAAGTISGRDFESMEGAAAALAGKETGIPVCEVRAISNMAAARDMRPENIALALGNLGVYMARWLESLE